MEFFSIYDITYSYSVTWGVTETKAQNDNSGFPLFRTDKIPWFFVFLVNFQVFFHYF